MRDAVIIIVGFLLLALIVVTGFYNIRKSDTEKAKAGLQQCLESGIVLWKKECKNEQ